MEREERLKRALKRMCLKYRDLLNQFREYQERMDYEFSCMEEAGSRIQQRMKENEYYTQREYENIKYQRDEALRSQEVAEREARRVEMQYRR